MKKEQEKYLGDLAAEIRNKSLDMAFNVGKNGAHLGGGLSLVEVFTTLYGAVVHMDTSNPHAPDRDRVIISKGHCVLSYYTILNKLGLIPDNEISAFETNGAILHGHATRNIDFGIEFSGGSLGMGISYAIGVAMAGKLKNNPYHVYVIVGDGECNEGIVWESIMSASHFCLDNLTLIIDNNKLQYDGNSSDIMNMGSLSKKLDAFGFQVNEVDGHNVCELYNAFHKKASNKPNAIIANTIKGKGVSFMENKKEWHHAVLTQALYDQAKAEQNKSY